MAKQEAPREDLIRDATALIQRIEFSDGSRPVLVAGFRENGSASFYFGEEPVYHFNAACELRRAHWQHMLKAERGKIVRLIRRRVDGESQLVRHVLSATEQAEFLDEAQQRLTNALKAIQEGSFIVGRSVNEGGDALQRVVAWLESLREIRVSADAAVSG